MVKSSKQLVKKANNDYELSSSSEEEEEESGGGIVGINKYKSVCTNSLSNVAKKKEDTDSETSSTSRKKTRECVDKTGFKSSYLSNNERSDKESVSTKGDIISSETMTTSHDSDDCNQDDDTELESESDTNDSYKDEDKIVYKNKDKDKDSNEDVAEDEGIKNDEINNDEEEDESDHEDTNKDAIENENDRYERIDANDSDNDDEDYDEDGSKDEIEGSAYLVEKRSLSNSSSKNQHSITKVRNIQIRIPRSCKSKQQHTRETNSNHRGVTTALNALTKKVLHESEKMQDDDIDTTFSLVTKLLQAHITDDRKSRKRNVLPSVTSNVPSNRRKESIYTSNLNMIALDVVEMHKINPNMAQIDLINLVFRSVGASHETYLNAKDTNIEYMNDNEWQDVVKDMFEQMELTTPDRVLISVDPDCAIHTAVLSEGEIVSPSRKGSLINHSSNVILKPKGITASVLRGIREYRLIYEEFWYILGITGLSTISNNNCNNTSNNDNNQAHNNDALRGHFPSVASRFSLEIVNTMSILLVELAAMNQPDIRAAATIAVLELACASLDKTIDLKVKLKVTTRQYKVGQKNNPNGRKALGLKSQIDVLKQSCEDLENLVLGVIFQGVIMHRYRDSNQYIRAISLHYLSKMIVLRPDIFFTNTYLKYFGWMMSDKDPCVRKSCFGGLLTIFNKGAHSNTNDAFLKETSLSKTVISSSSSSTSSTICSSSYLLPIDSRRLENLIGKFLLRIVDCVIDVDYKVQEMAMSLLLVLLHEGFLDDWESEHGWNQVNLRAFAEDTTPLVRRDALYFVIDQLDPFDDYDDNDNNENRKKQKSLSPEMRQSERLGSIATWVAYSLTDGNIPIENMKMHLVYYVVHSLRHMPEHNSLITNWSTILGAILSDDRSITFQHTKDIGNNKNRAELAKQRVLLEMLVCAARLEFGNINGEYFITDDFDSDFILAKKQFDQNRITGGNTNINEHRSILKKQKMRRRDSGLDGKSRTISHENLTMVLLKFLPRLLISFKGDVVILRSLTSLPQYFRIATLNIPHLKLKFKNLIVTISDIFLESTDSVILQNTALALTFLSRREHSRQHEAILQLERITCTLQRRLVQLLTERKACRNKREGGEENDSYSNNDDTLSSTSSSLTPLSNATPTSKRKKSFSSDYEHAICLCLKRFRILSKRCNIANLPNIAATDETDNNNKSFFEILTLAADMAKEQLQERTMQSYSIDTEDNEAANPTKELPKVWTRGDQKVHSIVATSISEVLTLLLSATAWRLHNTMFKEKEMIENDKMEYREQFDVEAETQSIIRMRCNLQKLITLCFHLHVDDDDVEINFTLPSEYILFSDFVQTHAGRIANDLRSLFPKEWIETNSPLLRECALTEDSILIGGYTRFLGSKDRQIRDENQVDTKDNINLVNLILPICRGLCANWLTGNRIEAGTVLKYIIECPPETSKVVMALSRVLQKIGPVKLVEAHMVCLRQCFQDWLDSEPEEIENDYPSEGEMVAFEQAEKDHTKNFQFILQLATKLSLSLGVGKLKDVKLSNLFLFVKEGIKYSFSSEAPDIIGTRLSFLSVVSKYLNWFRKKKQQMNLLGEEVKAYESELRNHPNFDEIYEDDIAALVSFQQNLGIRDNTASPKRVMADDLNSEYCTSKDMDPSRGYKDARCGSIAASSVDSIRSRLSIQSSSPPLNEDSEEENEEHSFMVNHSDDETAPSPLKRIRLDLSQHATRGSQVSLSTIAKTQVTQEESSRENTDNESESYE